MSGAGGQPSNPGGGSGGTAATGGAQASDAGTPTTERVDPASVAPAEFASLMQCDGRMDGFHCIEHTKYSCNGGAVTAVSSCGLASCASATDCGSPGSPSSIASTQSGLEALRACKALAGDACGGCLVRACCDPIEACQRDLRCVGLLNCLAACGADTRCTVRCERENELGAASAEALFACSSRRCGGACGVRDACEGTTADAYACAGLLGRPDDANRLYLCGGGVTIGSVLCPEGCMIRGQAGQPFYSTCVGNDPCNNYPFNATACGANLSPTADPATLFTCINQRTRGSMVCTNGCLAGSPGRGDRCL